MKFTNWIRRILNCAPSHIEPVVETAVTPDPKGPVWCVAANVYLLTQPSNYYYEVMTRNERMPVFIGQAV